MATTRPISVAMAASTVDGYSIAGYASFHPQGGFYVDGLLGYQWLTFDARRFITDNGNTAYGSRDGRQWFASFSTGFQHRLDNLLLTRTGAWTWPAQRWMAIASAAMRCTRSTSGSRR